MANNKQYEDNLASYIGSLKDTSINFVFLTNDQIQLKTTAKSLGSDHYVTGSHKRYYYYLYIYKASNVKYFMTSYQDNVDHIRILNLKEATTEDELGHPYTANHGDHLTFGIRRANDNNIKIDTHETIYKFINNEHNIGYFEKEPQGDSEQCTFEFQPIINKRYSTFLKISCSRPKSLTIGDAYTCDTNKQMIFHLLNKMSKVDVSMPTATHSTIPKSSIGGSTKRFEYKGIHFLDDTFLGFIQRFTRKLGVHVGVSMFYDSSYKNIICFIDFEEVSRIGLVIHLPKALKACYAYTHPNDASKRETKILKTFENQFDIKITKIKKYIYDEGEK